VDYARTDYKKTPISKKVRGFYEQNKSVK